MEAANLRAPVRHSPLEVWFEFFVALAKLVLVLDLKETIDGLGTVEVVELASSQLDRLLCADDLRKAKNMCVPGVAAPNVYEMVTQGLMTKKEGLERQEARFLYAVEKSPFEIQK